MRIVTEEEAGGLYCPIRSKTEEDDPLQCDGPTCMAWEEFEGLPRTAKKGYCNLIYKQNSRPEVIINHVTHGEGCSIEEPNTKELAEA